MSCSRTVTRHRTNGQDKLVLNSNSAKLDIIMNNACATLDFKLLAIEKEISPNHGTPCLYDPNKADFSDCSLSDEHAHLYISTNILNQHYIILFADKTLMGTGKICDLVDKFDKSIKRFKKQDANFPDIAYYKKLRFLIYFYGAEPPFVIDDIGRYYEKFSRSLEQCLGYNKNELDSCVVPEVIGDKNYLTISLENNLLKFVFRKTTIPAKP
jgi:hypothetical protein